MCFSYENIYSKTSLAYFGCNFKYFSPKVLNHCSTFLFSHIGWVPFLDGTYSCIQQDYLRDYGVMQHVKVCKAPQRVEACEKSITVLQYWKLFSAIAIIRRTDVFQKEMLQWKSNFFIQRHLEEKLVTSPCYVPISNLLLDGFSFCYE